MKVAVCLDDHQGMMFNHRRQSQDQILRKRLLSLVRRGKLWMDAYSAEQFADVADKIHISDNFLEEAGNGTFCFVEDKDITPYLDKIGEVIIYRWNRSYPGDVFFKLDLSGWKLESTIDFAGSSHEKITEERYLR